MTIDHMTFFFFPFYVVMWLCWVVLICFVELSFIFAIYILLLKKSGCVVFLECSAPSCDSVDGLAASAAVVTLA